MPLKHKYTTIIHVTDLFDMTFLLTNFVAYNLHDVFDLNKTSQTIRFFFFLITVSMTVCTKYYTK
jgi:hypothetical protein